MTFAYSYARYLSSLPETAKCPCHGQLLRHCPSNLEPQEKEELSPQPNPQLSFNFVTNESSIYAKE